MSELKPFIGSHVHFTEAIHIKDAYSVGYSLVCRFAVVTYIHNRYDLPDVSEDDPQIHFWEVGLAIFTQTHIYFREHVLQDPRDRYTSTGLSENVTRWRTSTWHWPRQTSACESWSSK